MKTDTLWKKASRLYMILFFVFIMLDNFSSLARKDLISKKGHFHFRRKQRGYFPGRTQSRLGCLDKIDKFGFFFVLYSKIFFLLTNKKAVKYLKKCSMKHIQMLHCFIGLQWWCRKIWNLCLDWYGIKPTLERL